MFLFLLSVAFVELLDCVEAMDPRRGSEYTEKAAVSMVKKSLDKASSKNAYCWMLTEIQWK